MNIENHIIPYFEPMGLRVNEVTPKHIVDFNKAMCDHGSVKGGPLKGKSVQKFYANLKTAFDYAQDIGIIRNNPARAIHGPTGEQYEAS
ncbi:MAG: hypothetical protein ACOYJA_04640, partial [Christensenellales bacterium]